MKVIEVYYNTKAEFNNIDRYKSYKFLIEYDKNIKIVRKFVRKFVRIYNNYKINDLFIRRIDNIKIIEINNILKIYIRIQVL